jgi:hypothetical protein
MLLLPFMHLMHIPASIFPWSQGVLKTLSSWGYNQVNMVYLLSKIYMFMIEVVLQAYLIVKLMLSQVS